MNQGWGATRPRAESAATATMSLTRARCRAQQESRRLRGRILDAGGKECHPLGKLQEDARRSAGSDRIERLKLKGLSRRGQIPTADGQEVVRIGGEIGNLWMEDASAWGNDWRNAVDPARSWRPRLFGGLRGLFRIKQHSNVLTTDRPKGRNKHGVEVADAKRVGREKGRSRLDRLDESKQVLWLWQASVPPLSRVRSAFFRFEANLSSAELQSPLLESKRSELVRGSDCFQGARLLILRREPAPSCIRGSFARRAGPANWRCGASLAIPFRRRARTPVSGSVAAGARAHAQRGSGVLRLGRRPTSS